MMSAKGSSAAAIRLNRPVSPERDHVRGGASRDQVVSLVVYGDYLCPYCRELFRVIEQLRSTMGESLQYVYRHLPNERVHVGAELMARAAEGATVQGRFWDLHDWLYEQQPPITSAQTFKFARQIGMDGDQYLDDIDSKDVRARVQDDLTEGRENGITVTPTIYIDGVRYDDAWDSHSLSEALRRTIASQVKRSARAFADLPASAGLILLIAAGAALVCANSPMAPYYNAVMDTTFAIGPQVGGVSMTIAEWFSEGLLSVFFLLVGLEIRREVTSGALTDPRAAVLPVAAAVGGVLAPAAVYLAITTPQTAMGWSIPTATDVAFVVGILALLGNRIPSALRVFAAALAVVDDILSMLTLAIFYPHSFAPGWLIPGAVAAALLVVLNRARVYTWWPYLIVACALWSCLHATGIHAALAGVVLAATLPTRPAPDAGPLLAQAATALAELKAHGPRYGANATQATTAPSESWEAAGRHLLAASARLLSPAERMERVLAPWTAYFILPLFAFSASGVGLALNLQSSDDTRVFLGVVLGLALGKPIGILLASWMAIKTRIGAPPPSTPLRAFVGAACLCGIGDTVALLMADEAFPHSDFAAVAKVGVLAGSALAAVLGVAILASATQQRTPSTRSSTTRLEAESSPVA